LSVLSDHVSDGTTISIFFFLAARLAFLKKWTFFPPSDN